MSRFIKSFRYAIEGLIAAAKSEANVQFHLVFALIVVLAGFFFAIHAWEWVAVILCISMVMGMELINTSIEKAMDLLHPDQHPKVKIIKDIAAGAVLLTSIGSAIIGLIIFLPKILVLFGFS